jgi:hypothetical protein
MTKSLIKHFSNDCSTHLMMPNKIRKIPPCLTFASSGFGFIKNTYVNRGDKLP